MHYNYRYTITFKENEPFNVNYVNDCYRKYPNDNILVEVANTKGITSNMLRQLNPRAVIRIAGGYDKKRVEQYKHVKYKGGETGEYFYTAVIYTRNETIKIVEAMEKIEAGLDRNWLTIQKVLYIYNYLRENIMYDPKHEQKLSSETRSLRGLITKNTVCAGYAMIFKELMDRNGIYCEYARGCTRKDANGEEMDGHAWNIIEIDGKKYPIDLTWDNTIYRSGITGTLAFFGKPVKMFAKNHIPGVGEKTQNYLQTLSDFDMKLVNTLASEMGLNRVNVFNNKSYEYIGRDNSRFIVTQVGDVYLDGTFYYKYHYTFLDSYGKEEVSLILYSETNLEYYLDRRKYGEKLSNNYLDAFVNTLFSAQNIFDSFLKKSAYIGKIEKGDSDKDGLVASSDEIEKSPKKLKLFNCVTKCLKRSDGSIIVVHGTADNPQKINDISYYKFDVFERVNINGKSVLKENVIYSEQNIIDDKRKKVADDLLSRKRLDSKEKETGGYIGYLDEAGICRYNPTLVPYFQTSRAVNMNTLKKENTQGKLIFIPDFDKLKELALNYEYIPADSSSTGSLKVIDIKTGALVPRGRLKVEAIFANMWLKSAGVKTIPNEKRSGITYAFNENARWIYANICDELFRDCRDNGVINTVKLFSNMSADSSYQYTPDIIVNLFRDIDQTYFINLLFLSTLNIGSASKNPVPLYTVEHAKELLKNMRR